MATLTRQEITQSGLVASYASAGASGDVVDNRDGKTFLHVKNENGGSVTVTIAAQSDSLEVPGYGTLAIADITEAVADGAEAFIGPVPRNAYNNASHQLEVSYSATSSVTIAALYIDQQPV
ncbi:MAG TPA: hypothetical protein VD927_06640 [Chryseosolibacter sp.]|nr:hypothetical protein [Chryseosolibacter sp.]